VILQHNKRVLGLFFTVHAQKRLFTSFWSKIWPRRSLRRRRFPVTGIHFCYVLAISLVRMRRNSVNSASRLKLPSPSCSATTICYKGTKIVAFVNTVSEFWAYFHRACAETGIQELPVKNLTLPFAPATSSSYKTDAFALPSDVYWIYSMFLCYYVAWPCDLDLWPFDLESVSCTVLLVSDPHTDFYYPTTIGYWVTSTECLITFPPSPPFDNI